jgi:membrane protease YdiL (CAAX protease family)
VTDSYASPDSNPYSSIANAARGTGGPRTSPLLCWLVILASIAATLAINHYAKTAGRSETQVYGAEEEALAIPLVEMQARFLYPLAVDREEPGAAVLSSTLRDQMQQNVNPYAATPRLAAHIAAINAAMPFDDDDPMATVAINLDDLDEAQLAEIDRLAAGLSSEEAFGPKFAAAKRALLILAANEPEDDAEATRLLVLVRSAILETEPFPADVAEELRTELGWFGQALIARNAPAGSPEIQAATRPGEIAILAMGGLLSLAVGGALIGVVLLIVGVVLFARGSLKARFSKPVATPGIYLEAFALYLGLLTFGVQGGSLLLDSLGVPLGPAPNIALIVVSFLAVAWPFFRAGAPKAVVAQDMGLHRGKGFVVEAFMGIVGYLAGLPIVGLGLVVTLTLITLQGLVAASGEAEAGPPPVLAHPIILWLADGSLGLKIFVLILGAIFAPFVEETLFRGNLLAYLRHHLPFVPAALAVAFIFAVIHPQGLVAVPVLMGLAVSFAMIREWRGSLIGPMVAHGLNNGTVLTLLWIVFM